MQALNALVAQQRATSSLSRVRRIKLLPLKGISRDLLALILSNLFPLLYVEMTIKNNQGAFSSKYIAYKHLKMTQKSLKRTAHIFWAY